MAKQAKVKEERLEDILFSCRNHLRGRAPMTLYDREIAVLEVHPRRRFVLSVVAERYLRQSDEVCRHGYATQQSYGVSLVLRSCRSCCQRQREQTNSCAL